MSFRGKVAIVTGASTGIGRIVSQLYAQKGVAVVLLDINRDLGERVADEICQKGGEAIFLLANVTEPSDCKYGIKAALNQYGRLDYACNNAGIAGELNYTADYSIEGWQRIISTNLSGVFYCMKYEIPAMLKNGGGAIVNMSSILGQVGFAGLVGYVAAKHGVVGLTKNAALEYATQGIRVNAVGPSFISTPMIQEYENDPGWKSIIQSLHPIGRMGKPEEVAELVIWLSSEKASFVTGAYYPIDGGYYAR